MSGMHMKNLRSKNDFKILKIFRNRANDYVSIQEANIGDIVVL